VSIQGHFKWFGWYKVCIFSKWLQIQTRKAVPYLGFPPRRSGFEPRLDHVGFVVDKVALGQVFSEYFGFPCQFSFRRLLHIHHHLSSGARTIGQLVADVPSGLSLTPLQETKLTKLQTWSNLKTTRELVTFSMTTLIVAYHLRVALRSLLDPRTSLHATYNYGDVWKTRYTNLRCYSPFESEFQEP
jgi:hypothetical protein